MDRPRRLLQDLQPLRRRNLHQRPELSLHRSLTQILRWPIRHYSVLEFNTKKNPTSNLNTREGFSVQKRGIRKRFLSLIFFCYSCGVRFSYAQRAGALRRKRRRGRPDRRAQRAVAVASRSSPRPRWVDDVEVAG